MPVTLEYHLTMKQLPENLRPRERLAAAGVAALSEAELLAVILRTGSVGETALELASRILAQPGGLVFLIQANHVELAAIKGIGRAKAGQVKAALELGRRAYAKSPAERPVVRSPEDAAMLVKEEMRFLDRENFRLLLLNTKNQVLAMETVSIGSLNTSLVHPREVFKHAIRHSAAALILVHNHPSGDPSPSTEDREVTNRLVEAGRILGIEVLDHLVIGDGKYISLKEKGLM